MSSRYETLPVLPLRDVVVYPSMVIPLFVGRAKSIAALEHATANDKKVFLVAQKDAKSDDPGQNDLYEVGTVATVLQMLRLPDDTVKVLIEGVERAQLVTMQDDDIVLAEVEAVEHLTPSAEAEETMVKLLRGQFEKYSKASKKVPPELAASMESVETAERLCDSISAHLSFAIPEKQKLLELATVQERVEHLVALMESELDLFQVEKRIRGRVKEQMERSQREYYLNEQMKAIQKEMGEGEDGVSEFEELETKINEAGMPQEAKEKSLSELGKLKMMSPMSAEATVVRGYLDWIVGLPWKKRSRVKNDLGKAQTILDADHHGLEEVKERILEYLAVLSRAGSKVKGPVLCLVGPPGVGKTSLGESIARATNRKFVRVALGGVRDESEIRGHRRTYIGSMPGKIIQKMSKVGVRNPLFLLDEIDKMGMDHRGDPASALLEVLDPEQNHTFSDHYLEVDYDLSEVMFVCTSNSMNIPGPLLDRMEVIRLPGYTEDEKSAIAERYLVPKQQKNCGLKPGEVTLQSDAITSLIRHYTKEAGVRGLERQVAKVLRKATRELVEGNADAGLSIESANLEHYAGVEQFSFGVKEDADRIGQVTGLAWTSVGGELLTIEAVNVPGKGKVTRTGSLGDVMQESITAALTVCRSRAESLGISPDFYEKQDLHIHVPEGAVPKDGPSAGIGMCTALVSVLTGINVKADVAMTGEITLRGQVLQIGGLKEKLLAAHRGGIKTVLIPKDNQKDLKEIPDNVKGDLKIIPVAWIDEVLDVALVEKPSPKVLAAVAGKNEGENDKESPLSH